MNTQTDKDLLRIKGHFLEKYGEDIDPWEARMHHEAKENFNSLVTEMENAKYEIQKARMAIKGPNKSIRFNDWKEALAYGLGRGFFAGVTLFFLLFFSLHYIENPKLYKKLITFIQTTSNIFKTEKSE